jgi:hypothetical protein
MSGYNGAAANCVLQRARQGEIMETVVLIETLIGVILVTVLGFFTLKDLIARYPIYPAPFMDGDERDDSDAE